MSYFSGVCHIWLLIILRKDSGTGRMQDTCKPGNNITLKPYRIYSILVPSLVFILMIEGVMIFMKIPVAGIGSALSLKKTI